MRWSRSAVAWTVVIVALMVILTAEGIAEWRNGEPAAGIVCWVIAAAMSVCALWTPLRIIVTDRQIQLCRPVGRLRINRSDIVRVEEVSSGVVLNSFRVGSGGPFGYHSFRHKFKRPVFNQAIQWQGLHRQQPYSAVDHKARGWSVMCL